MLQTGQIAPDFELPDQDGTPFRLTEWFGAHPGQWLLLVFYPGDETPVCTRQLCEYSDGIDQFSDLGVEVVGISGDDAESHRRFREKRGLSFPLLSDTKLEAAGAFGCRGMMGMKRGVFLLDDKRVCRYAHVEAVALFRRSRDELIEAIEAARAA